MYDYLLSATATPGGESFRRRQQRLPNISNNNVYKGCNLMNLSTYQVTFQPISLFKHCNFSTELSQTVTNFQQKTLYPLKNFNFDPRFPQKWDISLQIVHNW